MAVTNLAGGERVSSGPPGGGYYSIEDYPVIVPGESPRLIRGLRTGTRPALAHVCARLSLCLCVHLCVRVYLCIALCFSLSVF